MTSANSVDTRVKDEFVYRVGEIDVRLPSLSYLKPGLVRRIRRLNDVDALYTLMELSLSAPVLSAVDDMDPDDYKEFLSAWRRHSGISLGES
ncbi:hypothetical protein JK358_00955 [Nocardia sp. 2]|uniref:Tail assembly chaperone E/41/14-like protein n=1 Tax=Nocardia acididurans TaxID=2802282 RepID=A0ABS1LXB7_9NOCA|nr:hypothetical protein [Nocardia acididurans]MBL1072958.1 hypothetical protein [Nocardia acididurans]